MGDQHIREIRGADRGGRHGGQDLPDDRGLPDEASGYAAEDHQ